MSFIVNTVVIFAVTTAAVLFTPSSTAPTAARADLHTLPYYIPLNPTGEIQQDFKPVPGIGDWFIGIFDNLTKIIAKNQDPEKIEEVRKSIKKMRTLVTPVANFIQQYYPNNFYASTDFFMKAIDTFDTLLEYMAKQPMIAMSQKDVESLAKLMKMLKKVTF